MVRRTVLAIGILCGASAVAALAFASEISRVVSHLAEGAVWRGRDATAVPSSGRSARGVDRGLVASPDETPREEFCRFPPRRTSVAAPVTPTDMRLSDSLGSTRLVLDGQSRIPNAALPPALCAGDTSGTPLQRSGKP